MTAVPCVAFLAGAPGGGELLLLFLIVLVLFGPKRLPEIARTLSRVMNDLRRASMDFRDQIVTMDEDAGADAKAARPGAAPDRCDAGARRIPRDASTGSGDAPADVAESQDNAGADEPDAPRDT